MDKKLIEVRISQANAKYKDYCEIAMLLANDIKEIVEEEFGGEWKASLGDYTNGPNLIVISKDLDEKLSSKKYDKFFDKVLDFEEKLDNLFDFGELCLELKC